MDINNILLLKQQIDEAISKFKTELGTVIQSKPLDGVKPMNDLCALVSFSAISQSGSIMLSPEYYLPSVQEEAVRYNLLRKEISIEQLMKNINEMRKTKKATYKSKSGSKISIFLNDNTLAMLDQIAEKLKI